MKIREFLTEANWGKGHEVISAGKTCLIFAIGSCYLGHKEQNSTFGKIQSEIGGGSLMKWNDAPERTFAEVKALVERLDV